VPALVLLILVVSILVGCGGGSSTPSTLTTLSAIDGDVSVMETGTDSWTEGKVGMSLEDGDVVKTGDDSSAEITFSLARKSKLPHSTSRIAVTQPLALNRR
jgi:hypothetical protein